MGMTRLRRLGFAACILTGAATLAGCAPTGAPSAQAPAPGRSGAHIAAVTVNTEPLLGQSGDPTADWAQTALTAAFAQNLAGDMAPGDATAKTLRVRVNSIILGPIGPEGGATDWIRGTARLGNGTPIPVRATTFYTPMTVDQTLWEQALQGRVQTLSQAFADAVKSKLGL